MMCNEKLPIFQYQEKTTWTEMAWQLAAVIYELSALIADANYTDTYGRGAQDKLYRALHLIDDVKLTSDARFKIQYPEMETSPFFGDSADQARKMAMLHLDELIQEASNYTGKENDDEQGAVIA